MPTFAARASTKPSMPPTALTFIGITLEQFTQLSDILIARVSSIIGDMRLDIHNVSWSCEEFKSSERTHTLIGHS